MTKAEIETRVMTADRIFHGAIRAYERAKFLTTSGSQVEREAVQANLFMRHARFALWYVAVVESCKVFQDSDSQKYNLHKLLNILENGRRKAYLRNNISASDIEAWRAKLQTSRNQDTVEKLLKLRNKLYAHTDDVENLFPSENTPSYDAIEHLFATGKEVLFDIASSAFDSHLTFNRAPLQDGKAVLEGLAMYREKLSEESLNDIQELRRRRKGS